MPTPGVVAAPACGPVVCFTIRPKLSYWRCSTTCPSVGLLPEMMSRMEFWWSVNVQKVLVVEVGDTIVPVHDSLSTARISSVPLP